MSIDNQTGSAGIHAIPSVPKVFLVGCAAGVAVFFGLLLLGAGGDLWFDEVWSLAGAVQAPDYPSIAKRAHDNNHLLNTVWMRFCQNQNDLRAFRMLSVACGILSFCLSGWLAYRKAGIPCAVVTLLLVGTSYPLVLYFSEARGYAGAIFCGLAAYWIFTGLREHFVWWKVAAFGLVSAAGLGFHSTFLFPLAALGLASVVCSLRKIPFGPSTILQVVVSFLLPALAVLVWYFGYWKNIVIGGGPIFTTFQVLTEFVCFAFGLPMGAFWGVIGLAVIVVICGLLFYVGRGTALEGYFWFLLAVLLVPTLILILEKPEFLYFRYFLILIPFLYLGLALLVARFVASKRNFWVFVLVATFCLMLVAHFSRIQRLIVHHRGNYQEALARVWAESPDGQITITSDNDERSGILIAFYSPPPQQSKHIAYVRTDAQGAEPADWFVLHTQDVQEPAPNIFQAPNGSTYFLVAEYPFEGVSGWRWALLSRQK